MPESFSAQEVALLIGARHLLKEKGLSKDSDVKTICEAAGISRKTGYQWACSAKSTNEGEAALREELTRLKTDYEELKKRYERSEWENEAHKLAWEIHGVDELIASKKNTTDKQKRNKR
jgi:transcriptional regulator with XRE-family HTH domain